MEALANIARLNTSAAAAGHSNGAAPAATPVSPPPVPVSAGYATASYNAPPLHGGPVGYPGSSTLSPVNGSQPMFPMAQPPPPPAPAHGTTNSLASILGLMAPAAPAPAPAPAAAPGLDPAMQRQLAIIQTLVSQGVPYEQIPALMQSMLALAPSPTQGQYPGAVPSSHGSWSASAARPGASRDEIRSPTYRGRSRSRSPGRGGWHSPRGNGHERFGDYGRNSPSRDGRRDYRQRSPRRGRSPTPPRPVPRGEKLVEYDRTLPRDHIKVLSRTLFVGGVTCSEAELRSVFTRFGEVQTCIVNREKRHAFVKMTSRKDAETAKAAMEKSRGSDYQFRTRWGVGFGPRDCSDFNNGPDATGTSIIPIHKLTEADCKWMLSAEFGGSGGKPIEHGLVVEEPDIEIGAGVSSKAISRRLQTGKGGGPDGEADDRDGSNGYGGGGGWRAGGGGARRTNSRRDDGPAAGERPAAENPMLNFPYGLSNALASLASYQAAGYAFPDPNQTNQH
jgi:protein NRD1